MRIVGVLNYAIILSNLVKPCAKKYARSAVTPSPLQPGKIAIADNSDHLGINSTWHCCSVISNLTQCIYYIHV